MRVIVAAEANMVDWKAYCCSDPRFRSGFWVEFELLKLSRRSIDVVERAEERHVVELEAYRRNPLANVEAAQNCDSDSRAPSTLSASGESSFEALIECRCCWNLVVGLDLVMMCGSLQTIHRVHCHVD